MKQLGFCELIPVTVTNCAFQFLKKAQFVTVGIIVTGSAQAVASSSTYQTKNQLYLFASVIS
jgi:hypothetical protein